jgi:hypothetical protein
MTNATAAPVRLPGYLVQIGFASVLYLTSRATITWNGHSWVTSDLRVNSIASESSTSSVSASITVGNADNVLSGIVLTAGEVGQEVGIWKYYTDSVALADPVQLFNGVVQSFDINNESITFNLLSDPAVIFVPRIYLTPSAGFNYLPMNNQRIWFHSERYRLVAET